ncbi:MAG: HAD hydrolase-like protein [Rhodoplanes sp.]|uniref:HAD hydrolase-like protein n=1 Tax=Rhodoplanes sp. TaxID=1968906 RepID=UPI00184D7D04|nr:HAD hydrolase-like protein [Rhodoplanes sp.]NVO16499.1 HAD hydrolase-like protein [Rhodoplanes sp.]
MKYRLVIFDIDGTLADSFPWFLAVLNGVADRFGFRRTAPDEVVAMRNAGAAEILERLAVPRWKLPLIVRHMRALKTQDLDQIPLFPGVDALLATLFARGAVLAVVSSDTEANVRRALGPANAKLIAHFGCGASLFGKPPKFRAVLRRACVPASEAIAIGDEVRDIEAARTVGIACGAVAWGYADATALRAKKPDLVFERMEEIVGALE